MNGHQVGKEAKRGHGVRSAVRDRVVSAKLARVSVGPWWIDGLWDPNRHLVKNRPSKSSICNWKRRTGERNVPLPTSEVQEGNMQQSAVAVTTRVGVKGAFDVDLSLDVSMLNERIYEIGLWLIDRHIPHQARILWEPNDSRIRVSFPDADDAGAFRRRFGPQLH